MAVKRLAKRDGEAAQDSLAFAVDSPISLEHLGEELAGGSGSPPVLVAEGNLAKASEDDPITVWVVGVDTNAFKKAVKNHAGPTQVDRPAYLDKPEDEAFTDEEIQQALRYLLKRGSA